MLKLSIYSAIWIFIVLLLVSSAIKTNQDNIINKIDPSSHYYTYNHCYKQRCGRLSNLNDSIVNFTHPFQGLMSALNEICVHEPTSITRTELEINYLKNATKYLDELRIWQKNDINDISTSGAKEIISNTLIDPIYCYANDVYGVKSKSTLIDRKWKRRTLCAVYDDEKSQQTFQNNEREKAGKRTLVDYDEPIPIDEIEDQDSLTAHVRVKRSKWDPLLSSAYRQDYLKDLANSFPRNAYESIDENSYDDISFDAKREIKAQEFSPSDEITDTRSFISSSNEDDKSVDSNNKINALESSKEDNLLTNRRLTEDTEVEDLPEDPMLAVDLVRRKRNNLMKKTPSDSQNSDVEDENQELSGLVAANLKAHLFRLKRKSKNDRQERSSKPKKKKKHGRKKQDKKLTSLKDSNKLRTPRKRKVNGGRRAGKSNVGIAKVVSNKNNKHNFRRRFVESKKSIESTNGNNDPDTVNSVMENNDDNSEFLATGNDVDDDLAAGSNDAFLTRNEKQQAAWQTTKLREKRDKNSQASHGFLSKEDELRYYENIREPETYEYVEHINRPRSVMNKAEGDRAARSIEEVKDLAQRLVTKVNELQNFIQVEDSKETERQKRVGTRAIDDLCSNSSTSYDAFNEPNVVQKCVSLGDKQSSSPVKIVVERKIDPSIVAKDEKLVRKGKEGSAMEKKRSIIRPKRISKKSKMTRRENEKVHRKWGRWTDWSSCSVTCGKGRQIRWRYCLHDCTSAETEMEEKACQLPACPPGKFLGIF